MSKKSSSSIALLLVFALCQFAIAQQKGPEGPYSNEREAESGLITSIEGANKGNKHTIIIFNEDLSFRRVEPERSSAGDLIFVCLIYTVKTSTQEIKVDYSPCSLEPESPQLFIGDTSVIKQSELNAGQEGFYVKYFPPRRCYNSSVTITIKDEIRSGSYNLLQYNRYRGTLQVGVLWTDHHIKEFGLQTVGDTKQIYEKGPSNPGPEYFTSLVIYSIPRYFEPLIKKKPHYSGRDVVNDQEFCDRLGGVIGVGLNDPGKRFVLGLSFEIAYGINVVCVLDAALQHELSGTLEPGAEFAGNEEDIPIHKRWNTKLAIGLSLDLRYITALFSRK